MAITYNNVGGAEPSTVTFRAGTVQIARGSTNEQQEILVLGDPQTSNAIARVVAAAPASTEFGLIVRIASGPSSAADLPVQISGNSTVLQGTNPWTIAGNSSVWQGSSAWQVQVTNTVAIQGNSTVVVASGNSSVIITSGNSSVTIGAVGAGVRMNIGSTAADNAVMLADPVTSTNQARVLNVAPGSTEYGLVCRIIGDVSITQGSTTKHIEVTNITGSALNVGGGPVSITFPAGYLSSVVAAGNSSGLLVRNVWSSTAADQTVRAVLSSTSADNPVVVSGNSTVLIASGNSSVIITSGNSSVTISAVAANLKINIGSTAAENAVLISGNSTVFQGTNPWIVSDAMQSSVAPSSGSSGVIVRPVIDAILTTASTTAFAASTSFSIQSSGAGIRSYVVAYSITTTNAGPVAVSFVSGSTLIWPVMLAAVSSAISGVNLAVSAPAYLFRTKVAGPLSLRKSGSTIVGYVVGVSYFRAP